MAQTHSAPAFKQVNASDNPNHEKKAREHAKQMKKAGHPGFQAHDKEGYAPGERQTSRDAAEIRNQAAKAAAATGREASAEEKAAEAQQGRGPAGLNTGPSDTRSADPKNPPGYPTRGNPTGSPYPLDSSPGQGFSPPQSPAPTSDRPEDDRLMAGEYPGAKPELQQEARQQRAERQAVRQEGQEAREELKRAENAISESHRAPGDQPKSKSKRKAAKAKPRRKK